MKICRGVVLLLCLGVLSGCCGNDSLNSCLYEETFPAASLKIVPKLSDHTLYSMSNQSYGWGLVKVKGALPQVDDMQANLLKQYDGYYHDTHETEKKIMYLTFDEGYENGNTSIILDVLKSKKIPAAFFITGSYLEREPDLVKRMVDEGHIVGNHTVHHPSMPSVTDNEALAREITELNEKFYALTRQNMKFMRPPCGEFSERTLALTQQLQYHTILWSFAYRDWDVEQQMGAENAYQSIVPYFHPGAVLLLHAVSSDNATILGRVIDEAQRQGYQFYPLTNLCYRGE